MAILIGEDTRILVLGITGKSGSLQTRAMLDAGANIVAGVTPGKGGEEVHGVPVFDTVAQALAHSKANAAISFVPPRAAKASCLELIDSGVPLLVITTEGTPDSDVRDIFRHAQAKGTRIVGPGTAGLFSPGKSKLGSHPPAMYKPGRVGIVSKSGALSYEVGRALTMAGIGQSTVVSIGGGPLWGTEMRDALELFEADSETDAVVLLGEIGGTLEQQAAEFIAQKMKKPVVALIVGRHAPAGKSLGHAGAIIDGGGGAEEKLQVLREAGAHLADTPRQIVSLIQELV